MVRPGSSQVRHGSPGFARVLYNNIPQGVAVRPSNELGSELLIVSRDRVSFSGSSMKTSTPIQQPSRASSAARPNLPLPSGKKSHESAGAAGSSTRPCREHSFLTDVADVREMEQGLLQLLDDFHSGKLQAFGGNCSQMDQIREQQEHLARLHFELDTQQELKGYESAEARDSSNKNLGKLMDNLQELCTSIQNLQRVDPANFQHS